MDYDFIKKSKGIYCYMNCDKNSLMLLKNDIKENMESSQYSKLRAFYEIRKLMYGFKQYLESN